MSTTAEQLREMDRKNVLVTTRSEGPISIGQLRIAEDALNGALPRLDLHFETETMQCVMRVPPHRLDALKQSWDGVMYRYCLPGGEELWKIAADEPTPEAPGAPVVETFPLPTSAIQKTAVERAGSRGPFATGQKRLGSTKP